MRSKVKFASVLMIMVLSLVMLAGCGKNTVTLRRITYELPGNYKLNSKLASDMATYTAANGFEQGAVLRFNSNLASLTDSSAFEKECLRYADSCLKSIPEVGEYSIVANSKCEWLGMPAVKFTANATSNAGTSLIVEGIYSYDADNNAIYNISLTRPTGSFDGDFDSILSKASIN
ncbi:MAG: hypothetical protein IK128_02875 [Clostridiales bacterium]|nr:hypothetical protein [Clostridiales bacterium]